MHDKLAQGNFLFADAHVSRYDWYEAATTSAGTYTWAGPNLAVDTMWDATQ